MTAAAEVPFDEQCTASVDPGDVDRKAIDTLFCYLRAEHDGPHFDRSTGQHWQWMTVKEAAK